MNLESLPMTGGQRRLLATMLLNAPLFMRAFWPRRRLLADARRIWTSRGRIGNQHELDAISKMMTGWGDHVLRLTCTELRVEGPKPSPGATLFVANHQGYMDIPTLCSALRTHQFSFVASDEFSKFAPIASGLAHTRGIFIAKHSDRQAHRSMEQAQMLLSRGFSLLIFPEGQRSRGAPVGPFRPGSLRPALKARVSITPVSIEGTWKILERSGRLSKNETVYVRFHPPIMPHDYASETAVRLAHGIEDLIRRTVKELKSGAD